MISKAVLRELVDQKLKDAEVLVSNRRYAAAIYLAGYALEIALKLKICKLFKFLKGFPENKSEFSYYLNSAKSQLLLSGTISEIREIRIHDLQKLLFYSGVEYQVKLNYLEEWNLVAGWSPEMRYQVQKIYKREAVHKTAAIRTLIEAIL